MLRFFHQIRQKLLDNGNFRKYLWYALGEILLVMIGILLALQVNNWNEERKLREKEQISFQKMADNLENDILLLGEIIQQDSLILKELSEMSNQILEATSIEEVTFTNAGFVAPQFYPNKSAFNNLESSGQLDIIRNKEIIDLLLIYYRSVTIAQEGIDLSLKNYSRDIENFFTYFDHSREHPSLPKKSIEEYRKDPFLLNSFYFKYGVIERQIYNYEQLMSDASEILKIINEELKH